MAITPIPSSRISQQFISHHLISQVQADQIALFRLQNQISTGRRINLPSDDAPSAMRGIDLQSLIERKEQIQTNLGTNQEYLSTSDVAVSSVSSLISHVRALALSVADTTSSDTQRLAVTKEIDQALKQLVDIGNQQFRGRYLFAGSLTTVRPFELTDDGVVYHGNELEIRSNADIDLLFQTNIDGNKVFGALSDPVRGTADLNPILTSNTRLSELRGGLGISEGSITVSDGIHTSTVDLSSAETIGDVVALLEANAPPTRTLYVDITNNGLKLSLDAVGGGNLTVQEVAGGTTARELSILEEVGVGVGPLNGGDLDPKVTLTTSLSNILGVRATALISPSGTLNDMVLTAADRGPAYNGTVVTFVAGGVGTAGSEVAVYDAIGNTLTVTIESGVSTTNQIMAAINAQGTFQAALNPRELNNDGTGTVLATAADPLATGTTSGGSGVEFDQTSGLQIVNGGKTHIISLASAVTVEDMLNILNGSQAGILAEINEEATGINIRSRVSGNDFAIGENGGLTATQLGVRSFNSTSKLEDLNYGRGVDDQAGADFIIQRKDGVQLNIDVTGAVTIQDIIDRINNDPLNAVPATKVTASLNILGNGIQLSTSDVSVIAPFAVLKTNRSNAATDLGLIADGAPASVPATVVGASEYILGWDTNRQEVGGLFHSLIKLKESLLNADLPEISRNLELLDNSVENQNFSRAELGARQQGLDVLQERIDSEMITLRESVSKEIETEMTQAISDMASKEVSYQASLRIAAQISQMTLLDYL